jgi:cytochrome c oxidase subunit 2
MVMPSQPNKRRVLIASSHGLFAQGLRSLLSERQAEGVEVVGVVSNVSEAISALEKLNPDLIIVDYDDEGLYREEFLARFVEGERKLRVVLLSLQSGNQAIIYDRRTMEAAQVDDWLDDWTTADEIKTPQFESRKVSNQAVVRRDDMKNRSRNLLHLVVASFLVLVGAVGVYFLLMNIRLLPVAASAQAKPIDDLFKLEIAVISFLFSLIVVFIIYSMVVFRRKKGDLSDAAHVEGNTKLEITWTVLPLATVLVFAVLGGQSLQATLRPDPKPLIIRVIGQQWSWRFEYPQPDGFVIVSDKMMMPVDRQAELRLSSNDVIHSFWVPEFRVKQDALPGGESFVRKLLVTPTETGQYTLRCAELCGEQHATMESSVVVVSQEEFDAWVAAEAGLSADPVERGAKWAQTFGCLACHSLDGSKGVGPTWLGMAGSERTFIDGSTAIADDAYLLNSILNPNANIVEGFPAGIMPQNFGAQMSENQISDVIAYIKSLK